MHRLVSIALSVLMTLGIFSSAEAEKAEFRLDGVWRSIIIDADSETSDLPHVDTGFEQPDFNDVNWETVVVPHNWQEYSYARQVRNGTRHGTALYRKEINIKLPSDDERIFIRFEGVGTYATVWLNGVLVGRHAGALTSFDINVSDAVKPGMNTLALRVDNPYGIVDLPWAPGDDQPKWGYSEGSQPFGIFRPVRVIRTTDLHIRPFGIYAWGGLEDIGVDKATLTARTEVVNDSSQARSFTIVTEMVGQDGTVVATSRSDHYLNAGKTAVYDRQMSAIDNPQLWTPDTPTLYTLRSTILEHDKELDQLTVPYGIRTYEIRIDDQGHRRFYVNGKQYHIQGTAEYEHLLGKSHAFSDVQINSRIDQFQAAGFNTFRDAHYPHNLRYADRFAMDGIFWWAQFSAHNWHDNQDYRNNFKSLLADWVRERRNNPALFFWGLQNESEIPAEFAKEAIAIIRQLDPTTSIQRLVVACNGGEGTDWNVPQNWSGTYGGNPDNFAEELKRQGLVGEYGAWRSLGWHSESDFEEGKYTENHAAELLQKKARLADSVAGSTIGHLQWLLVTHENPGRPMHDDGTQIWDGIRPLDRVGPANNKGLLTLWGEPTDLYYMYRARQVPASEAPVVYIVSHTWTDRWIQPGRKSGIEVYSNCDSVELYNDVDGKRSLGRRQRNEQERFIWDNADIKFNVLTADCVMGDEVVARDRLVLNNLPSSPDIAHLFDQNNVPSDNTGNPYLFAVNVGGQSFTDSNGIHWLADRQYQKDAMWGWSSWAEKYTDLDPALGSRGVIYDPIRGTNAQSLFQTFRYGMDKLRYRFKVPDGSYNISLYFVEPWYGRTNIDATAWRVFDVAVNNIVELRDFDIFREAGFGTALRKDITVQAKSGVIEISFPYTSAGQAIISGITIAPASNGVPVSTSQTDSLKHSDMATILLGNAILQPYLDNANPVFADGILRWTKLPYEYLDQDYLLPLNDKENGKLKIQFNANAKLVGAIQEGTAIPSGWTQTNQTALATESGQENTQLTRYVFAQRKVSSSEIIQVPSSMPVIIFRELSSPYTPGDFNFDGEQNIFEAEDGDLSNGRVATTVQGYSGQGYVVLEEGSASIGWSISTGLAKEQEFTLRYRLPEGVTRTAAISIVDKDHITITRMGTSLAGKGGWNSVQFKTPTRINAGEYKLNITFDDGSSVLIDSLSLR